MSLTAQHESCWQVTLPHLCAGVIVNQQQIIVRAAPILAWSVGKPLQALALWIRTKHAQGTLIRVLEKEDAPKRRSRAALVVQDRRPANP